MKAKLACTFHRNKPIEIDSMNCFTCFTIVSLQVAKKSTGVHTIPSIKSSFFTRIQAGNDDKPIDYFISWILRWIFICLFERFTPPTLVAFLSKEEEEKRFIKKSKRWLISTLFVWVSNSIDAEKKHTQELQELQFKNHHELYYYMIFGMSEKKKNKKTSAYSTHHPDWHEYWVY